MSIRTILSTLIVGLLPTGATVAQSADNSAEKKEVNRKDARIVEYFCPMHPFIVRHDPRYKKCPICFMPLSKMTVDSNFTLSAEDRVALARADLARSRTEVVPAVHTNLSKLAVKDRILAEGQGWCPILECNPLGVMGPPFKTSIGEQTVFLCCKECEEDAKIKPEQTLAKVEQFRALAKKQHHVKGKILSLTVSILHEDIPGVLKKGRMEFSVEGIDSLESLKAGDSIQATLKLTDGDYKLIELSAPKSEVTTMRQAVESDKTAKLTALRQERLATLRGLAKLSAADYQAGRVSFDRLHQVHRAMLHAELELCDSEKERTVVLEKVVALTKEFEKSAEARFKSGQTTQSDVLMARDARLEAEIAVERQRTKTSAPPK